MGFWTDQTRAAGIGVLGVAVGGVVGGFSAYLVENSLSDQQLKAVREERQANALGAARLMETEFQVRYEDLAATVDRMRFPTQRLEIPRVLSEDARRRVAERMRPTEWEKVVRAEARIGRVERLLDRRRTRRTVTRRDLRALSDYIARFKAAAHALATFAASQES